MQTNEQRRAAVAADAQWAVETAVGIIGATPAAATLASGMLLALRVDEAEAVYDPSKATSGDLFDESDLEDEDDQAA